MTLFKERLKEQARFCKGEVVVPDGAYAMIMGTNTFFEFEIPDSFLPFDSDRSYWHRHKNLKGCLWAKVRAKKHAHWKRPGGMSNTFGPENVGEVWEVLQVLEAGVGAQFAQP